MLFVTKLNFITLNLLNPNPSSIQHQDKINSQ